METGNTSSHFHKIQPSETADDSGASHVPLFANPFQLADLCVFDDPTLERLVRGKHAGVTSEELQLALHEADPVVQKHLCRVLPLSERRRYRRALRRHVPAEETRQARQVVLDKLFWELTYWKTPALYEELTEGEQLHPGIFQHLAPLIHDKIVLDVGAGSGRATFACLRAGARHVYAVEPSPGLLRILQQKLLQQPVSTRISCLQGRFDNLPLPDKSVDVSLSCSAFLAEPQQGGDPALAEFQRVTRSGGKIVLIWPRQEDLNWLLEHGFHYVTLPLQSEMHVRFRSLASALRCARRFYARNTAVLHYLLCYREPEVPFSVLGVNPPCDYCWLEVV